MLYSYSSKKKTISLSGEIIKLVINFIVESGRFDRPLIRFNQECAFYIYIYIFHLFGLSNSVNYNFCKFLLLLWVVVNLAPTAPLFIFFFQD